MTASFRKGSWDVPPIFSLVQSIGGISEEEMYRVFNMGVGMVAVCEKGDTGSILDTVPDAVLIGDVVERTGDDQVILAD